MRNKNTAAEDLIARSQGIISIMRKGAQCDASFPPEYLATALEQVEINLEQLARELEARH